MDRSDSSRKLPWECFSLGVMNTSLQEITNASSLSCGLVASVCNKKLSTLMEAVWPSGLGSPRFKPYTLPLAGFVLDSPEFKSSVTLSI